MKKGRSHEVLLSLVLSGVLPRKRIASFLLQSSAGDITGVGADGLAARLGLKTARRRLLEQSMPEARRVYAEVVAAGARIMSLAYPEYPPLLKSVAGNSPRTWQKNLLTED